MWKHGLHMIAAAALFAPPSALADAASTAAVVRAADEAWSKRTEAAGPAQTFPETMDPVDGLYFSAGPPLKGREAIAAGTRRAFPAGSHLSWTPTAAYGSKSGDMGVTSGDWTFSAPGLKAIHGRYVTVWRKDGKGEWKALMDIGNPDPS